MDTVHKNLNSKWEKMLKQRQNYFCILNSYQTLVAYLTFTKKGTHIYESYSHSRTKSSKVISLPLYNGIRLLYIQLKKAVFALCKQVEEKTPNSQNVSSITEKHLENWLGILNYLQFKDNKVRKVQECLVRLPIVI